MNLLLKIGKRKIYFIIFIFILSCFGKPNDNANYLGQIPPNLEPKRFAKDILFSVINSEKHEELHSSIYFSPDSKEIFYTIQIRSLKTGKYQQVIKYIQNKNNKWISPQTIHFSGKYNDNFLNFSKDGKRIYFNSERPLLKNEKNITKGKLWYSEKIDNEWSAPKYLGSLIENISKIRVPSYADNKNMYFYKSFPKEEGWGEILFSKFENEKYQTPIKLDSTINTKLYENFPLVSPKEKFLIFYRLDLKGKGTGQYISFKDEDNNIWSEPINMGKQFNSGGINFTCTFSPDYKYIFYLLRRNNRIQTDPPEREEGIYWISSEILKDLHK